MFTIGIISLAGCSGEEKPSDYVENNSRDHNCYSYAFDLPFAVDPGELSNRSDYMYLHKSKYTPEEITKYVIRDMDALGKAVRVVDGPEDKNDNEYIVAMKTSDRVLLLQGIADYHFAVLLSDGTWADKPGRKKSRWNKIDGMADTWDCGFRLGYYNTDTVFFAVER